MNDVPLVNKNDINSINTSIIAIKKQLMQLNEAVGLIDTPDVNIDLTPFVKKTDIVNTVQSGNMNPVTSNAVYNYLPFRIRSFQKRRVTISSINNHGYVIMNLSDMGFTALDDNYIVCICNNIRGGAGVFAEGNGASSLIFFNSTGENRTNVIIDVAIIYLI